MDDERDANGASLHMNFNGVVSGRLKISLIRQRDLWRYILTALKNRSK